MTCQTLRARFDQKHDEDLPAFVGAVIGDPSVGYASLPADLSAMSDKERGWLASYFRHQTKLS